jgi:hypothetical protein
MRDQESADDKGRFEGKGQRPSVLATTQVARSTAFEAVLLIKPPALPGVSDFRDAKQYWGLEDFMNVTSTGVTNAANLSLFMVNVASCLRADGHAREPDYSVLDLKADYRGYKYVEETIKMLPEKPEPVLLAKILNQVARSPAWAVFMPLNPPSAFHNLAKVL